jgi:hypothetical protein
VDSTPSAKAEPVPQHHLISSVRLPSIPQIQDKEPTNPENPTSRPDRQEMSYWARTRTMDMESQDVIHVLAGPSAEIRRPEYALYAYAVYDKFTSGTQVSSYMYF